MSDFVIELMIFEANGEQLRVDGTHPDFTKEGICAWVYGGDGEKSFEMG